MTRWGRQLDTSKGRHRSSWKWLAVQAATIKPSATPTRPRTPLSPVSLTVSHMYVRAFTHMHMRVRSHICACVNMCEYVRAHVPNIRP